MAKRVYRVLNPRGIAKGVHIITVKGQVYYEGDEFPPPPGMPVEHVQDLVDKGFIVSVVR